MTATSERRCPSCGQAVPVELGQHADNLLTGAVTCPHCGATVTLAGPADSPAEGGVEPAAGAPPGQPEEADSFSGQETAAGVAEELRDKPT